MENYKAIIYDLDGTILDTLKMNMLPLMKIIEEETGNKVAYEEVLKYAAWPGMETLADLNIDDREKLMLDGLNMLMNLKMVQRYLRDLKKYLINLMEEWFKQLYHQKR